MVTTIMRWEWKRSAGTPLVISTRLSAMFQCLTIRPEMVILVWERKRYIIIRRAIQMLPLDSAHYITQLIVQTSWRLETRHYSTTGKARSTLPLPQIIPQLVPRRFIAM